MKDYPVITLNLYIILTLVNRMVIQDDGMSELYILLQKSLRYQYHRENYIQSLEDTYIDMCVFIAAIAIDVR